MDSARTRKIKSRIVVNGKRIWIPGIPFWFLKFALRIVNLFLKKSGESYTYIKKLDIPEIFREISNYGPLVLADIEVQKDNTKVFIETR